MDNFGSTIKIWCIFGVAILVASVLGKLAPKIGLPLITGYLIVGAILGPFGLGLFQKSDASKLGLVTQFALAFICFSAGAELYLPELRVLFKRIVYQTAGLTFCLLLIGTLVVVALGKAGLAPFMLGLNEGCSVSAAAIVAAILVTASPAAAIALIKETKATGPFTSTLLGITVLCDVFVIMVFTLTTTIAESECKGEGFSFPALLIMFVTIFGSIGIGYIIGRFLILLMRVRARPLRFLILPLGLAIFVVAHWFTDWTHENLPYVINVEPLLICITGGYICTNNSNHRGRFMSVLQSAGPIVFLPFFVATGLSLDMSVLAKSIGFALIVASTRGFCLFLGTFSGGYLSGQTQKHNLWMWASQMPQAGVSLGLAAEVGMAFPGWGRALQTAIISVVLVNQVAGPILFRIALKRVNEAGKGSNDEIDEGEPRPRALVIGYTASSMAASTRLLHAHFDVTLLASSEEECIAAKEQINNYAIEDRRRVALAALQKPSSLSRNQLPSTLRSLAMQAISLARSGAGRILTPEEMDAKMKAEDNTHGGDEHNHHNEERPLEKGFEAVLQVFPKIKKGDTNKETVSISTLSIPSSSSFSSLPVDVTVSTPPSTPMSIHTKTTGIKPQMSPRRSTQSLLNQKQSADATLLAATEETIELRSKLGPTLSNISLLEAVFVSMHSDEATFCVCEALTNVMVVSKNKAFDKVRIVANIKSPEWTQIFEAMNIIPIVDALVSSSIASALLTSPLSKPVSILPAPGSLNDLRSFNQKYITEGLHLWDIAIDSNNIIEMSESHQVIANSATLSAAAASLRSHDAVLRMESIKRSGSIKNESSYSGGGGGDQQSLPPTAKPSLSLSGGIESNLSSSSSSSLLSQISHVIRTSVEFNDEEDEDESNIDDIRHRHGNKTSTMNESYRHNIEMLSDANLPTQVLPTDEHLLRGADRRKDGLGSLEVLNEVSVFTDLNTRMGLEENNKNLNKDEEIDKTLSKHGV
jgi:Kef-type K+ transport system membrane component KefB